MTVQDLCRVLVGTQPIEIHNPNDAYGMYGRWSGKAKDIPSRYFEINVLKMYPIFYSYDTEFSFYCCIHLQLGSEKKSCTFNI